MKQKASAQDQRFASLDPGSQELSFVGRHSADSRRSALALWSKKARETQDSTNAPVPRVRVPAKGLRSCTVGVEISVLVRPTALVRLFICEI